MILAISFACNTAVLFVPFMNLRTGLTSEPYSLFRSITMFWESGLYVLAILVFAFSVMFPFAKLAVLGWVNYEQIPFEKLSRAFHLVERFAKWSMLDVFLVCLILALTSGQFFVGATPLFGIALFSIAILLSMFAGEMMGISLHRNDSPEKEPTVPPNGWLLALSGIALLATLLLPFLGIHDWRLVDRNFSIVMLVPALISQGAVLSAGLTAVFLVLLPVCAWILSLASWIRLRRKESNRKLNTWAVRLRRWGMLEVFGLALAVFALEGDHLMKIEMQWGALLLAGTLALQAAFDAALSQPRSG